MDVEKKSIASSLDDLFSNVTVTPRREFLQRGAALLTASTAGIVSASAKEHSAKAVGSSQVTEQDRSYMAEAIKLMRQAGVVDQTGGLLERPAKRLETFIWMGQQCSQAVNAAQCVMQLPTGQELVKFTMPRPGQTTAISSTIA